MAKIILASGLSGFFIQFDTATNNLELGNGSSLAVLATLDRATGVLTCAAGMRANWVRMDSAVNRFKLELSGFGSANGINFGGDGFVAGDVSCAIYLENSGSGILHIVPGKSGTGPGLIYPDAPVVHQYPERLKGYTVATLPAGTEGDCAYVTDATAPTYLGALTGGGSVKCKVFRNATTWVSC